MVGFNKTLNSSVQNSTSLFSFFSGVLALLPDRINISRRIRRDRTKNVPANPTTLEDFENIPEEYQRTSKGENFVLYDSYDDPDWQGGRIVVFSTSENIRRLFQCRYWFTDGTFKLSPLIFLQIFTILGSFFQPGFNRREEQMIGIPLVYALLQDKAEISHRKVFEVVIQHAQTLSIAINFPGYVMCDFELSIINAIRLFVGVDRLKCCLFHLCHSVWRHIQAERLVNNFRAADREFKIATQMLCALAFVAIQHVKRFYLELRQHIPDDFLPIYEYFGETYVLGPSARNGRQTPARYPPYLWNVFDAALEKSARTNNISEAWHSRFQGVVGKHHPSLYAFLKEILKEQADSEVMMDQLAVGQRVKKCQNRKRREKESRIHAIVILYNNYFLNDNVMEYLRNIGRFLQFEN